MFIQDPGWVAVLFQAHQDEKQQVQGSSLAAARAWSCRQITVAKVASAIFTLTTLSRF